MSIPDRISGIQCISNNTLYIEFLLEYNTGNLREAMITKD